MPQVLKLFAALSWKEGSIMVDQLRPGSEKRLDVEANDT
jgi:uncharacterized membrane protein